MSNRVFVKHSQNWGLDEKKVIRLALKVLKVFGFNEVELSLLFCGRTRAKKLNVKYRQMSYVPQVLSFGLNTDRDSDGLRRLGDVVICNEKLKYEVKFSGKKLEEVLEEWLRHGVEGLINGAKKKR